MWWGGLTENGTSNCGIELNVPETIKVFGEGDRNPLQYSCLENSMDRGAWWGYNQWSAKSQT